MPLDSNVTISTPSSLVHRALAVSSMALALAIAALASPLTAEAQTGSRLKTQVSPLTTLWMGPPGEIAEIRMLLQNGKTEEAVAVARKFVFFLSTTSESGSGSSSAVSYKYEALNALCVALLASGELDEALEHCDKAVKLRNGDWRALNSRATVHYLAGRYSQALTDYRQALAFDDRSENASIMLEHNIALAEEKLAGS